MAGNPLICEIPDFATLSLTKAPHSRKNTIKVLYSRGGYNALGWIIFETGFDIASLANRERIDRNGQKSINSEIPDFATLSVPTPPHAGKLTVQVLYNREKTIPWTG